MEWSSQLLEASRKPRNQRASPACWMRQGLYHRQFVGSYHGGPNSPSGPIMGGYINRTVMIQQGQPAYLYLDDFDCPKSKLPTQWLDIPKIFRDVAHEASGIHLRRLGPVQSTVSVRLICTGRRLSQLLMMVPVFSCSLEPQICFGDYHRSRSWKKVPNTDPKKKADASS
jgi:hypothetical protein